MLGKIFEKANEFAKIKAIKGNQGSDFGHFASMLDVECFFPPPPTPVSLCLCG
jgi:hypothetical protein